MSTVSPTQDRLSTPVRDFMRPGVVTVPEHTSLLQAKRAMVRHGIHAVLVVANADGRPLGWVTAGGLLPWLERDDLDELPAARAITESPHRIEPDDTARGALAALAEPGVSHLLVCPAQDGPPFGVVSPLDVVELVTRP
jgi:CBS domain-containing protein